MSEMEVIPSDEETKEDPDKCLAGGESGGKKLKLNDGTSSTSQESFEDAGSSSKLQVQTEENVDSGVSADKSESTSSESRPNESGEGPSNIVISAAPSSSLRAILLNIRRPNRARNYRKRRSPGHDSDSDSSRDSDDLTPDEGTTSPTRNTETTDEDNRNEHDFLRYMNNLTESEGSEANNMQSRSSSDNNDYDSDGLSNLVVETDSDDGLWSHDEEAADNAGTEKKKPSVLLKAKPKHNYFLIREIMNREINFNYPLKELSKSDRCFERNFYGSLHTVYRLKRLNQLNKHRGCVNAVNFHPEGNLLASGSDDLNVVVWDWARNVPLQTIRTGHKSNVFQSKFLYLNARSQLNIVTCARDGQVRLLQCPPSGGAASRRRLHAHAGAAHKLHVSAHAPHAAVSAGEDGRVARSDVRADTPDILFEVRNDKHIVPLYSVHGHPNDPTKLAVAGRDRFVRVYDTREATKPVAMYSPSSFKDDVNASKKRLRISEMHLTCAVYNHDGSEILGSYNDEDIFLFDTQSDVYDKESTKEGFTHRYSGHRNSETFKGVSFFGPKSEYIVSGSDCSYIYIWEKKTESIVQWMQGDKGGVVNCIETHPRWPVLATSGLDKDVKIWLPWAETDPDYSGLAKVVVENSVSQLRSPLFNDFLPTLYSAWRGERIREDDSQQYEGNIEFDGNVCTAF